MKSSAAILMASMPKLAPLVPAPISDGTSISFIFFINANAIVKQKPLEAEISSRGFQLKIAIVFIRVLPISEQYFQIPIAWYYWF